MFVPNYLNGKFQHYQHFFMLFSVLFVLFFFLEFFFSFFLILFCFGEMFCILFVYLTLQSVAASHKQPSTVNETRLNSCCIKNYEGADEKKKRIKTFVHREHIHKNKKKQRSISFGIHTIALGIFFFFYFYISLPQ